MERTDLRMDKFEQRLSKVEADNKRNIDLHIIRLLEELNSPFSKKPRYRYTYEEISEITGRSTGYISNLAQKYGLSRRNFKII